MSEQKPDHGPEGDPDAQGDENLTAFGEPLWVDTLKSLGAGLVMLFLTLVVGGGLAIAVIAPWGRASHDCSIYCVLERQYDSYFSDKPS